LIQRGWAWGEGEASGLWKMGQSIFNMGPEEVRFAPPQVRDFSHFKTPHVNTVCCILLYNYAHIFHLCKLKIYHMKELQHLCLFLALLACLQTEETYVQLTEGNCEN
jgi:hypothetical protein